MEKMEWNWNALNSIFDIGDVLEERVSAHARERAIVKWSHTEAMPRLMTRLIGISISLSFAFITQNYFFSALLNAQYLIVKSLAIHFLFR